MFNHERSYTGPFHFSGRRDAPAAMKIILGGEGNVGKTTLIRRLCTGKFDPVRVMTIGVDFHVYDIPQDQDHRMTRMIVWDVSGQDQYTFTRCAFYRGSKAIGLLYDVSNHESFERLGKWRQEIRNILPYVPLVVAANKTDLDRQVGQEEGRRLAADWGVPFFETSGLTGDGVREFFTSLADSAARSSYSGIKGAQRILNAF